MGKWLAFKEDEYPKIIRGVNWENAEEVEKIKKLVRKFSVNYAEMVEKFRGIGCPDHEIISDLVELVNDLCLESAYFIAFTQVLNVRVLAQERIIDELVSGKLKPGDYKPAKPHLHLVK
jgi:hypothetical protein